MIFWLQRRFVQRIVAALMVFTFLPLAGTAHACQAMRHLAAADLWPSKSVSRHALDIAEGVGHGLAARQPVKVLTHKGPCHLLVTVAVAEDRTCAKPVPPETHWPQSDACCFVSCTWPPPKHRPRLG